ncbi:2-amino-4-hydroxy-6-hydroxymethyldihydropteridine diphosphokinase [Xylanibacter brevis]|jgi:2-amino-4-hydroxy-6-hydroxymethyldihydropteridine diphosphokinase|uniref:2-amino-4-hydroxy-6- hydroxymethyldihydropteridine diphosphokinase n=1 Tax=Xylanibacter brevis TaxID=83231 RepID=UPI000489A8E4|nr:2-amino-4-hydroxy-6-hydroxymethyldihydropteridine diphosphokinase [Xylanibacter brevis]
MMHSVIISLASNHDAKQNLNEARRCLAQIFSNIKYSDELLTDPINAKRKDKYLNQLAQFESAFDAEQINSRLKAVEQQIGRTDEDRQQGIVRIDLDLLQHDEQRYHLKDWERPYVQKLLPEL